MTGQRPLMVRRGEAVPTPGPATPGMDRRQLHDSGDAWAGWVRTDPGIAGGWHTHGSRASYIYFLRGSVAIEFADPDQPALTATEGDFVFVPPGTVHREVSAEGEPPELFIVRVGSGPLTINVEDPAAGG